MVAGICNRAARRGGERQAAALHFDDVVAFDLRSILTPSARSNSVLAQAPVE
jgi:hypothetical protein